MSLRLEQADEDLNSKHISDHVLCWVTTSLYHVLDVPYHVLDVPLCPNMKVCRITEHSLEINLLTCGVFIAVPDIVCIGHTAAGPLPLVHLRWFTLVVIAKSQTKRIQHV